MRRLNKTLSYIALLCGILAALSCISISLVFYGMFCSVAGMLLSIIVIFQRTKYFDGTKWNHPSVIAMFLSSFPVIYLATIIFLFKDRV
jgi:uncharacterized membrane protein YjjP (DUF1212 family)